MLTTFNEVDMSAVMALRSQYKDAFEKRHGVKLGFMGFFVKAAIAALKEIPAVNAEIDGTDLVYKNHYDIGVAVGTEKGLVVPVVRDADQMSVAEIEKAIGALGAKAREGTLAMDDLQGGTFTISNGGVYGSLMSTPILNAPQSGILGMHKIQDRPVAINGQVVIRPMMYLALSYDHRVVDGKEAVTFLVRLKDGVEDPSGCCWKSEAARSRLFTRDQQQVGGQARQRDALDPEPADPGRPGSAGEAGRGKQVQVLLIGEEGLAHGRSAACGAGPSAASGSRAARCGIRSGTSGLGVVTNTPLRATRHSSRRNCACCAAPPTCSSTALEWA